jgi:murein DD-endopeptidase MepM/ murein hydrolase activator NlpD
MKMSFKKMKVWMVVILAAMIIVSIGWVWVVQLEDEKPIVDAQIPESLGRSFNISLDISDHRSGLRHIRAEILKEGQKKVLVEKEFPSDGILAGGKVHNESIVIDTKAKDLNISDGPAVLQMQVRDYSWRNWWHGNQASIEKKIHIDTQAPGIEVLTRAHNIYQGGSCLIIYRLTEPCQRSGVVVGDNFFPGCPGYFEDKHTMLAFFAIDYTQGSGTQIFLNAVDHAGNQTKAGFNYYLKEKKWKKDIINLSDRFLNQKMPEFDVQVSENSKNPLLDKFLLVNRKLRQDNAKVFKALAHKSEAKRNWEGNFIRLPNSARRAGFADHREYRYNGTVVDHQVHLGIDLASLAKAPVPAANTGKVIFADYIGIYGKTVVLDHGFGLMSLYSHLSSIDVQTGQLVSKGDILGRTGTTGLAGGDHLHFGMMVYETMINPIEWWDDNWIMHNITDKLKAVSEFVR